MQVWADLQSKQFVFEVKHTIAIAYLALPKNLLIKVSGANLAFLTAQQKAC